MILQAIARIRRIDHPINTQWFPKVTLLISARNELVSLPGKLDSIRRLDYPREQLQVLIASDASTDGTSEYLLEQKDIEAVIVPNPSGKNAALNQLLPRAVGEILFFTDANTILHPQCLRAAVKHFYDPRAGAVAGELIFTHDPNWSTVGRGTGFYWLYENGIKRAENRLGSVLVGSGALLAVRRELVVRLDPRVANDLEIPTRVGAQGFRVFYESECLGFEKPHTNVREELLRTSRIVARGFRGFWVLLPLMAKSPFRLWQFITHKFLRWFTLPLTACAWLSAGFLPKSGFPAWFFYCGILGILAILLGWRQLNHPQSSRWLRIVSLLTHFFIMNLAALWGILLAITGKTPASWAAPESSRNPSSH